MLAKLGLLGACLAAVSTLAQTPDPGEQSRALATIRDYALNYTNSLPDYTCTQVTRRTFYLNAQLRLHPRYDSIEEQIAFVNHKETYTVTKVNGEAVTNTGHDQLTGISSSGEFGSLLSRTFNPNAGADFRWDRQETQKGRRVYVFAFRVPQAKGYGLVESKRTIVVAYKGLVFADAQTGAVLRIAIQCDIPRDSEFKQLDLTLDYKAAEVAGREFVLPFHYLLHSRVQTTPAVSEAINEADYKMYRRFGADSSIKYDGDR